NAPSAAATGRSAKRSTPRGRRPIPTWPTTPPGADAARRPMRAAFPIRTQGPGNVVQGDCRGRPRAAPARYGGVHMAVYNFDVLVLGTGPAGEGAAMNAVRSGRQIRGADARPRVRATATHPATIP